MHAAERTARTLNAHALSARNLAALAVAAGALAFASVAYAAEPAPGARWWSHVAFLASDELAGRATGTPEYDRAAGYVADAFKAMGLKPAGVDGYYQPIRFISQTVIAEASSAVLVTAAGEQPLALGPDVILGARMPQPESIEAPLVFAGYGLSIPLAGHDDFAGLDLRGKIAVVINGGPEALPAAQKSSARTSNTWKALEAAGAVGMITLPTPKGMDIPWARQMVLASQPGMYLADPDLQDARGPRFTATLNPESAQKLFAASGRDFAEILALAEAGKAVPRFPLNLSLRARVATRTETVNSSNILAVLPGSDPALAAEYVLVSAHLDHLGVGAPINGDHIYNGAMDDASGVATVLDVARRFAAAPQRPKRSVMFAVFTAEEKGLLGSRAFAERPSVAEAGLAADLNLDMFLPLWPLKFVMIQGVDESSLGADARTVAARSGYQITTDPYPDRNSFVRTDQYSFVRTGVPALSLKFGFALGSPEQQMEKDWRTNRYHAPSDDIGQPVDLKAADDFNAYLTDLAREVAESSARPAWTATSIFRPAP